jgi:WD40 repeat protein
VGPVALAERVVEVIADRGESDAGRYVYGSGCRVGGRTVLTAAHVVAGALTVTVRDPDKRTFAAVLDVRFVGHPDGPGPDLALLELEPGAPELPVIGLAAVDRGSPDGAPVERCHAIGYPWFGEHAGPEAVRDTVDVVGHVPVLAKLASGLISLQVQASPRPLPAAEEQLGRSEWSGMSGAPLIAGEQLIGVVCEHAPREGPSAITATPLTALEADPLHPGWGPGVADPAAWWARLGVTGRAALTALPPRRTRPEPAYRATVREIQARTVQLSGRTAVLSAIAEFATGGERYRWLVGGPWAGKTAVMAATLSALPDSVDAVFYFLSRREADADSNRFLAAVVPQLADVLQEDSALIGAEQFRALWQRAQQAAVANGRHLLLVVDGLDEDLRPPGSPSVAALLPADVGANAHVLVSSRPFPELPADVPAGHPLRVITPVELAPFTGAAELATLARQEIDQLTRSGGDLGADVLGYLTAAAGPLSVEDLAELAGGAIPAMIAGRRAVRSLLAQSAARSLQAVGSERYQFAHVSLLEYARTDPDLGDPGYRAGIHAWAANWRAVGWPSGTAPRYLLDAYPATLGDTAADASDHGRLAALVTDVGWLDSATARLGVDAVLATVRTASALAPGVAATRRLLEDQADNLRHTTPPGEPGSAATGLGWQALFAGADGVVSACAARARAAAPPKLVATWISSHANPHLIVTLALPGDEARAIAPLDDGRIVSGWKSGAVRLWDPAAAGDIARELGSHGGPAAAVAALPGGRVVSGGEDGRLCLWDPAAPSVTGVELGRHQGAVRAMAVLPAGTVVSGGDDGAIRVWDPARPGAPAAELGTHGAPVAALSVLPAGRLVSGDDSGDVRVWDPAAPGQPVAGLSGLFSRICAVAAGRSGRILLTDGWDQVWEWDPAAKQERPIQSGRQDEWAKTLAVSAAGLGARSGPFGAIAVWALSQPDSPARVIGHQRSIPGVSALAFTRDGRLVSAGEDGSVRLWEPAAAGAGGEDDGDDVLDVAASADGRLVSGSRSGSVRVWDPAAPSGSFSELGRLEGPVGGVGVTPAGEAVSGGERGEIRLWPLAPGRPSRLLGQHGTSVQAIAVTGDGRVASSGMDNTVRLWDPAQPAPDGRVIIRHDDLSLRLAASPSGQVVSGGRDGTVRLWDPATPDAEARVIDRYDGYTEAVAVSAAGFVAYGWHDGTVRWWDPANPDAPGRIIGRHDGYAGAVAITPSGRVLSGGQDGCVCLWDPSRPDDQGRVLARHDGWTHRIIVAPGRRVAIATWAWITMLELTEP